MSPPEKDPELSDSSPPRAPLSDYQVALLIDRFTRDLKQIKEDVASVKATAQQQARLSWDLQLLLAEREQNSRAKKSERFVLLEREFTIMKRLAWVCVSGALGAFVIVGVQFMVGRVKAAIPPPRSNAERMGSDVVVTHPDAGQPTSPPLQGR